MVGAVGSGAGRVVAVIDEDGTASLHELKPGKGMDSPARDDAGPGGDEDGGANGEADARWLDQKPGAGGADGATDRQTGGADGATDRQTGGADGATDRQSGGADRATDRQTGGADGLDGTDRGADEGGHEADAGGDIERKPGRAGAAELLRALSDQDGPQDLHDDGGRDAGAGSRAPGRSTRADSDGADDIDADGLVPA